MNLAPPSPFRRKILNRDDLLSRLAALRKSGRKLVQCHGCFDIVHPGHIRYLEFARRQGDVLLVSLTGDSDIDKGAERPYIPQELRAENLAALEFVDFVHVHPFPTAERLLEAVRPEIYVKGKEYENSSDQGFLRERAIVEGYGGRVIFSSGETVFSSSRLIEGLPHDQRLAAERLSLQCHRNGLTLESLTRDLDSFGNLKVLVVGDTIVDRYVLCDPLNIASEAPVLSVAFLEERRDIGGAAIVARHIAALGAKASLITSAGKDDATREVDRVLGAESVSTWFLHNRQTMVEKTRYLADDTKLLKVERGGQVPLDSLAERRVAAAILQRSVDAHAVIFCDFGYGMITPSLLSRVLPSLRGRVPVLSADVSGNQGNLLNFTHVDLLCPTERELRQTLHDMEGGLSSIAWALLAKTQARRLFVTMDKRGLVAFNRRSLDPASGEWFARLQSEHWPSVAERIVDRLGCGDALLATATLALAAGTGPARAAYLGNAAAALEIKRLGNVPIQAEELRRLLRSRPELRRSSHDQDSPSGEIQVSLVGLSPTRRPVAGRDPLAGASR